MGFLRSDDEERPELGERELPSAASERLDELTGGPPMFTSGLSVNEFALLRRLGPQPLAQVMGASVVRVAAQYLPALDAMSGGAYTLSGRVGGGGVSMASSDRWGNTMWETPRPQIRSYLWSQPVVCRLDTIADAWNLARRNALARLRAEAMAVGANAVVGVQLTRSAHDLGKRTVEYVVNGTAIRDPAATDAGPPRLTDLSVQDYWRLRHAGYEPLGLLATTTAVFASASRTMRIDRSRQPLRNRELTEISQGFQLARATVRRDLKQQLPDTGATDAVGVELDHAVRRESLALGSAVVSTDQRGWSRGRLGIPYYVSGHTEGERPGWVITMHAAGTAIRRAAADTPHTTTTQLWMGAQ